MAAGGMAAATRETSPVVGTGMAERQTTVSPALCARLGEYILQRCYGDLEAVLTAEPVDRHYGLTIRVVEVFDWDGEVGEELLARPERMMRAFEEAIQKAAPHVLNRIDGEKSLKTHVHVRLVALPITPWTFFERIPTAASLGRLVSVRGTVVRVGGVRMLERSREWECARCHGRTWTHADDTQYGVVSPPAQCEGSVDGLVCRGVKFTCAGSPGTAPATSLCDDYQEAKIQERTSVLDVGAVPRAIPVLLRHELVDACRAGDDVLVTGILGCRMRPPRPHVSTCDGELFLAVTSVVPATAHVAESTAGAPPPDQRRRFDRFWSAYQTPEARWHGRAAIVDSFCPQIFGMFLVKLAVLLTVIGGADVPDPGDDRPRRARREGHLLLVGDPGTAKSQFLVNAARLVNRSVMTSGSGSTSAGLTVAAVRDGSNWQLEAGALVLADRGLCCIDEFNALRAQDRTAIHEAMEQQTLSVAKAGLVCKLNTRCSIVAACNAKGEFEEGRSISANLALSSPLLSRFDLVLLLLDRDRGAGWDERLCDRILQSHSSNIATHPAVNERVVGWEFDTLRMYVSLIRSSLHPVLTPGAHVVLARYYQLQRRADPHGSMRTTVRLLESLVRLSQAHAKLMFQARVELRDAIIAVCLMEASLSTSQTLPRGDLYAEAPVDFERWYQDVERQLLLRLEINPAALEVDEMTEGNKSPEAPVPMTHRDELDFGEDEELEMLLDMADDQFQFSSVPPTLATQR